LWRIQCAPRSAAEIEAGVVPILSMPRPGVIAMEDDPATYVDEAREMEFECVFDGSESQEAVYSHGAPTTDAGPFRIQWLCLLLRPIRHGAEPHAVWH